MITTLLTWLSGIEIGFFLAPLWKRFVSSGEKKDILLYGVKQPTKLLVIDNLIISKTGDLNKIQKEAHNRSLKIIKSIVNTRAFELYLAKIIKDNWVIKTQFHNEFKVF